MKNEREQFTLVQQLVRLDEVFASYDGKRLSGNELGLIRTYAEYCLISGFNLNRDVISNHFVPTDFSKVRELRMELRDAGVSHQKISGLQERGRNLSEVAKGI